MAIKHAVTFFSHRVLKRRDQKGNDNKKTPILKLLNRLHQDEPGQGLVEYLLILPLVAFAATAGMNSLATGLNSAFAKISTVLGTYIS